MEFSSESELMKLENIGHGTYGTVYRYKDKAVKIYHEEIKIRGSWSGTYYTPNPALRIDRKKLYLFKKYNPFIKNTDLLYEEVYINGRFRGVASSYIEGIELYNINSTTSFNEKKSLSMQLVDNNHELTSYNIYPMDIHLGNLLCDSNGSLRIIDLDDHCTKALFASNPLFLRKSLKTVKKTLIDFWEGYNSIDVSFLERYRNVLTLLDGYRDSLKLLGKRRVLYNTLENFILSKSMEEKVVFVYARDYQAIKELDFEFLDRLKNLLNSQVILTFPSNWYVDEAYVSKVICECHPYISNVLIYGKGEVLENKIQDYLNSHNVGDYLLLYFDRGLDKFSKYQFLDNFQKEEVFNILDSSKKLVKK